MARDLWTRDEMILVLNLYLKLPFGKMDRRNPDVIHLANIIGRTPNARRGGRFLPFYNDRWQMTVIEKSVYLWISIIYYNIYITNTLFFSNSKNCHLSLLSFICMALLTPHVFFFLLKMCFSEINLFYLPKILYLCLQLVIE